MVNVMVNDQENEQNELSRASVKDIEEINNRINKLNEELISIKFTICNNLEKLYEELNKKQDIKTKKWYHL